MASSSLKLMNWCRQRQMQLLMRQGSLISTSTFSLPFSSSTKQMTQNFPSATPSSPTADQTLFPSASPSSIDVVKGAGDIQEMDNISSQIAMIVKETEEYTLDKLLDSFLDNRKFYTSIRPFDIVLPKQQHQVSGNHFIEYLLEDEHERFEKIIFLLIDKQMVDESVMLFDLLFEHLETSNSPLPPFDDDFWAVVIPFLVKANEPYKLNKLFRMMKESGEDPWEIEESGCSLGSFNYYYDDIVRGFCYLWKFEDAAQFLVEQEEDCDGSCYSILLHAYCAAGKLDEADDLFVKMAQKNVKFLCHRWCYLIGRFCEEGEIDKAFGVLKRMIVYWDQRPICDNYCFARLSTMNRRFSSKMMHTLSDLILFLSRRIGSNGRHDVLGLAVYIMWISGAWKEGHKWDDQVHCASYYDVDRLDDGNVFPEKMIKKGAETIDSYAVIITELCGEGEIHKAFETLKEMITLWDRQHISVCVNQSWMNQTSTNDGLVPNLEPYLSVPDMIMTSLHKSSAKGDDASLRLAVYTMLATGVWKEALKIGENGGIQVPELPDVSRYPKWKDNRSVTPPDNLCDYF